MKKIKHWKHMPLHWKLKWIDEWQKCDCIVNRQPRVSIADYPELKTKILDKQPLTLEEYVTALMCCECLHPCQSKDKQAYIFNVQLVR